MKKLYLSIGLLITFVLWTTAVCFFDVQTIGPCGSAVGFATVNAFFHTLTGVNMTLYTVTDWLGLVPFFTAFGFAVFGLVQWIQRKKITKVDKSIVVLGGFYVVVIALYLLFEEYVINFRPVLIMGVLEASYPSSTTLLTLCVMPTAKTQLHMRIKNKTFLKCVRLLIDIFMVFMVIGRVIAGVHWISDIVGGVLLSMGLVQMYNFCVKFRVK